MIYWRENALELLEIAFAVYQKFTLKNTSRGTVIMPKLVPNIETELVYDPTLLHVLLERYNVRVPSPNFRFTEVLQHHLANPGY